MRLIAFAVASVVLTAAVFAAPAPKPGPTRLLVASSNKSGNWEIYLVHPDTKEIKNLTKHKAKDTEPSWSPDGKRIAFREWDEGKDMCQIAVVGEDGKGYKVLTAGVPHAHPRWSPDGKSLSYGRFEDRHGYFREKQSATLMVSDADGRNPRELLTAYGGAEWAP